MRIRRRSKKRRSARQTAYEKGKIAGFRQGKEDGYRQGVADVMKEAATAAAASATASSSAGNTADPVAIPFPPVDALVIVPEFLPAYKAEVLQLANTLQKIKNFKYELKKETEVSQEMIGAANIVMFIRNVEPAAYLLLELAHRLGKRTVYVLDDNLLEMDPDTPEGQYYADPVRRETCIRFLKNAQIVKVESLEMGNYIYEQLNGNYVYFHSGVDFEWLDQQDKGNRQRGQIIIGYEGSGEEASFSPLIPALSRILDYYGGFVHLELWGQVPKALADHPNVNQVEPADDHETRMQRLNRSNWDIGLAPLQDNLYGKCKPISKVYQYGACRIPGIYSAASVYASWIEQGDTGYLVPHTEEGWFEGIKTLIENPAMRLRIKGNAESAARSRFSLDGCIENWKRYVFDLAD